MKLAAILLALSAVNAVDSELELELEDGSESIYTPDSYDDNVSNHVLAQSEYSCKRVSTSGTGPITAPEIHAFREDVRCAMNAGLWNFFDMDYIGGVWGKAMTDGPWGFYKDKASNSLA